MKRHIIICQNCNNLEYQDSMKNFLGERVCRECYRNLFVTYYSEHYPSTEPIVRPSKAAFELQFSR